MRNFLLAFSLFALTGAAAQESALLVIEAESAALTPPVKVKRVNGYSGNAYVGDNDPGSVIKLNHVTVGEEGTYEFRVYYTSMFRRSVNITVNSYPAITLTMSRETPEWDRPPVYMMLTYIWLDKGDNTIIVTPPANDGGPNIDKFEIWETEVKMPKPEISNPAFSYDLSDDAANIYFNGKNLKNSELDDNDISTLYNTQGKSGYIEYELDTPHLITAYLFSEGMGAEKQGTDWTIEYSVDGASYSALTPSNTNSLGNATLYTISRQPHADKAKAARYYRIDTKGRNVAEIQLFGFPYISSSNNKNFPVDITEGITDDNIYGDPIGETGWFDETVHNLFDRNMETKYYTDDSRTCHIEVELPKAMTLESYTLTSCQDYPERDPKSWVLEGYDYNWEPISEIKDFSFPGRYTTMRFKGDESKLYRGFRLRVTENNGADRFQLLKMQFFGNEVAGIGEVSPDASELRVVPGSGCVTFISQPETQYYIYSIDGRTVAQGTFIGRETVDLSPGMYITVCQNDNHKVSTKVIVK